MRPSQVDVAAELSASKEVRAHLAFAGTCVAIGLREGTVLWASPSCAEVLGWRPEDLKGSNIWGALLHAEDAAAGGRLAAAFSDGDIIAWARLLAQDGTRRWYRIDALDRKGLVVAAFRLEADKALHHFHSMPRQA